MARTNPIENLVPRQLENDLKVILDYFGDLLEECVNFGSVILNEDNRPVTMGVENLPPTMLFRFFLDLLDAISILVRKSCGDPCKPLLRSAFESKLALEYLFEADTHNRSMAYVYTDISNQIKTLKRLHPTTDLGKDLRKTLQKEKLLPNLKVDASLIQSEIERLEKILSLSQFDIIKAEQSQMIAKGIQCKNWYGYFGGPRSIESMATLLNQKSSYEILYRRWSGAVHASDVYQGRVATMNDGGVGIDQIRHPRDVQEVTSFALTFALQIFQGYCKSRMPYFEQKNAEWYLSIRTHYFKILKEKMIVVD